MQPCSPFLANSDSVKIPSPIKFWIVGSTADDIATVSHEYKESGDIWACTAPYKPTHIEREGENGQIIRDRVLAIYAGPFQTKQEAEKAFPAACENKRRWFPCIGEAPGVGQTREERNRYRVNNWNLSLAASEERDFEKSHAKAVEAVKTLQAMEWD